MLSLNIVSNTCCADCNVHFICLIKHTCMHKFKVQSVITFWRTKRNAWRSTILYPLEVVLDPIYLHMWQTQCCSTWKHETTDWVETVIKLATRLVTAKQ